MWLWEDDGEPVSLANRALVGGEPGLPSVPLVRIGPVYTPPERRGAGYASANVAALSQLSLDQGCTAAMLFTDRANPTSNKVYQGVGYRVIGSAQTWLVNR
jgi:predicted GNAT family acetyltransferase